MENAVTQTRINLDSEAMVGAMVVAMVVIQENKMRHLHKQMTNHLARLLIAMFQFKLNSRTVRI